MSQQGSIMSNESSLDSQNSAGIQSPRAAPAVCSDVKNDVIRPNDISLVGNESERDNVLDGDVSKTSTPLVFNEAQPRSDQKQKWAQTTTAHASSVKEERRRAFGQLKKAPKNVRRAAEKSKNQHKRIGRSGDKYTMSDVSIFTPVEPAQPRIGNSVVRTRFIWRKKDRASCDRWWKRYSDAYAQLSSWDRKDKQINDMANRNLREYHAYLDFCQEQDAAVRRAGKLQKQPNRYKAEGSFLPSKSDVKNYLEQYDTVSGAIQFLLDESGAQQVIDNFVDANPKYKALQELPVKGIIRNLCTDTSMLDKTATAVSVVRASKHLWQTSVDTFFRDMQTMKMTALAKVLDFHSRNRYDESRPFNEAHWNRQTYDMALRTLLQRIKRALSCVKTDKRSQAWRDDATAAYTVLQRCSHIHTKSLPRVKAQPLAFVVHGKPGVGKTFLSKALFELYAHHMCGLKDCPEDFSYMFNNDSQYDDSYLPAAKGCIFDDVGQSRNAEKRADELNRILRVVNNQTMDVVRAEVSEKGVYDYSNIEIVAVTSNSPSVGCGEKSFYDPDAIFRRLNTFGFVHLYFDADVPLDVPWMDRWRFDVYDRWSDGIETKTYPDKTHPEGWRECVALTYAQFLEYAVYAFEEHKKDQDRVCNQAPCEHGKNAAHCYLCAFKKAGPDFQARLPEHLRTKEEDFPVYGPELPLYGPENRPPGYIDPDSPVRGNLPLEVNEPEEKGTPPALTSYIKALTTYIVATAKSVINRSRDTGDIDDGEADNFFSMLEDYMAESTFAEQQSVMAAIVRLERLKGTMDYIKTLDPEFQLKYGLGAVLTILIGDYSYRAYTKYEAQHCKKFKHMPSKFSVWACIGGSYIAMLLLLDERYRYRLVAYIKYMVRKAKDHNFEQEFRTFMEANTLLKRYLVWAWDLTRKGCATYLDTSEVEAAMVRSEFLQDCGAFLDVIKEWRPSNMHVIAIVASVSFLGIKAMRRGENFRAEGLFDDEDGDENRSHKIACLKQLFARVRDGCSSKWESFVSLFEEYGYGSLLPRAKDIVKTRVSNYSEDARYVRDLVKYYTIGCVQRKVHRTKMRMYFAGSLLLAAFAISVSSFLLMLVAVVSNIYFITEIEKVEPPPEMPDHFIRDGLELTAVGAAYKLAKHFIRAPTVKEEVRAEGVIASSVEAASCWEKPITYVSKNRSVRSDDMDSHFERCVQQVVIRAADNSTAPTQMLIVDGEVVTFAGHVIACALARGDTFTVEHEGRSYSISRSMIVFNDRDVAFVWLAFPARAPSLINYLPPVKSQFSGPGVRYGFDGKTIVSDLNLTQVEYVDERGHLYRINGYIYTGYSRDGYCGMPIVSSVKGANYIVGIHVAGGTKASKTGKCILTRLTREDYDAAREELSNRVAPTLSLTHASPTKMVGELGDVGIPTPEWATERPQVGSAECLGTLPMHSGGRKHQSEVTYAPWAEDALTLFNISSMPYSAPLCGQNRAYQMNFIKREKQCKIPVDALIRAREDYESVLTHSAIKSWVQKNVRVLTDQEAVAGVLEGPLACLDRLNLKTAAGFGHAGQKASLMDFEVVDDRIIPVMNASLAAEVAEAECKLRKGETCSFVWRNALKDEAVPAEKAYTKMRVFSVGQVTALILCRKYMGAINAFIQSHPFDFECALGANAHGIFWDKMARNMVAKMGGRTDRVLAGDYSAFDLCISMEVMEQACLFYINVAKLAGYGEEDICVIKGLFADIVRPTVILKDEVWQFSGSNPSGHPLTTFVNSIANSLYYRSAFYALNPKLTGKPFRKYVNLMTFGDDSIAGVAPGVDFPHSKIQGYFAAHQIKYTLATKQEGTVEYQDLSEVDFLKRRFVHRQKGWEGLKGDIWTGPLDLKSITKSLLVYIPSKIVTKSDQFNDIIRSVSTELSLHGPEIYDNYMGKVRTLVANKEVYGLPNVNSPTQSWREVITHIRNEGFMQAESCFA